MLYQKGGEKGVTKEGEKAPWQILDRDIIKYIAMVTMLLNHIATIFLERGTALYVGFIIIGYFTAITMIFSVISLLCRKDRISYKIRKGAVHDYLVESSFFDAKYF